MLQCEADQNRELPKLSMGRWYGRYLGVALLRIPPKFLPRGPVALGHRNRVSRHCNLDWCWPRCTPNCAPKASPRTIDGSGTHTKVSTHTIVQSRFVRSSAVMLSSFIHRFTRSSWRSHMTGKSYHRPRRRLWRCRYDHYYLPASRDRSCAQVTQQDRGAAGTAVPQCSRNRALAALPLPASEYVFAGLRPLVRPNG